MYFVALSKKKLFLGVVRFLYLSLTCTFFNCNVKSGRSRFPFDGAISISFVKKLVS